MAPSVWSLTLIMRGWGTIPGFPVQVEARLSGVSTSKASKRDNCSSQSARLAAAQVQTRRDCRHRLDISRKTVIVQTITAGTREESPIQKEPGKDPESCLQARVPFKIVIFDPYKYPYNIPAR